MQLQQIASPGLLHAARACLGAIAVSLCLFNAAHAEAPMVKTQAPGYYRMMLGDFEITAVLDGTFVRPVGNGYFPNTTAAKVEAALARAALKDPLETSVNAYLINTGTKLVLVDTGAAALFGPTLGKLLANLKAAGYQPEQVDEVYITHMHPDHVGGLMAGDKRAFPNATVRAEKQEADFWLSQANMDAAENKKFFQGAMASLNPYIAAGKFKAFEGNTELVPGVKAYAAPGHTAGHSTYVVESKGAKLVLWGDLIHVAEVQFPDPSVVVKFDTDANSAAAQRKKAFADAAKQGYWVAGAHLPFPGIGHIRSEGDGYAWIPASYSVPR